jgi:hypothetical protein
VEVCPPPRACVALLGDAPRYHLEVLRLAAQSILTRSFSPLEYSYSAHVVTPSVCVWVVRRREGNYHAKNLTPKMGLPQPQKSAAILAAERLRVSDASHAQSPRSLPVQL